jgi:8-oxo-dGTP diphosphatase
MTHPHPVPGAGVVCLRRGEVLLVKRGKPPMLGQWSLPGGKIAWGETASVAALRELREETGVEAEIVGLVDVVDGMFREGDVVVGHVLLVDYAARWVAGEPMAADDAADARFFALDEALAIVEWSETRRIIQAGAEIVARAG